MTDTAKVEIPTTIAAGWEQYRRDVVLRGPHTPAILRYSKLGYYAGVSQAMAILAMAATARTKDGEPDQARLGETLAALVGELDAFLLEHV